MGREDKIRQLEDLLRQTDSAYRCYRINCPPVDSDCHWSEWYAEYLIGHGFDLVMEDRLAAELLTNLLKKCRADHLCGGSPLSWQAFAARRIVEKLQ